MAEKRGKGRPTLLNKQLKEIAIRLANEPEMNITKLASKLGIGKTTLFQYLGKDKDFRDALTRVFKDSPDMANDLVEISFYRRATGYSHASEKIFCTPSGAIRRVKTVEHYPPDTKAALAWLERRDPERWAPDKDNDVEADKPIKLDYDDQKL